MGSFWLNIKGIEQAESDMLARGQRMTMAVYNKVFSLLLQVQSKIQGNLAAGIGLKSQHGTSGLSGSVRVIEPRIDGTKISGQVQGAGGNFWYGEMWEHTGHKEIVPITKRALHFIAGGKDVFAMRVAAQGPRPWFVPPFEEMKPQISTELTATVEENS